MPLGEPDLPEEGLPAPDTRQARRQACRRTGASYLVIGVPVLVLVIALSALTGNWRWLLYASPIVVLCLTLALILLAAPPDDADALDKPDDGAGRAAQSAIYLRR